MSTGKLNLDLLLHEIISEDKENCSKAIQAIMMRFPTLSEREATDIYLLVISSNENQTSDHVSLAITAPPSFAIKAKSTKNTVEELLLDAKKSILITGYSLSEYFYTLIDVIIQKSQEGVFVRFFANDIEGQSTFNKLRRYQGRFLKIYNYPKDKDSMAALHAKVISVDQEKTLITSANLSYHGQEGNIELGAVIHSKEVAKQVEDLFTKLVFKKVFVKIE